MILNETRRLGRAVGSSLHPDIYTRELRLILLAVGMALAGGIMTGVLGALTVPVAGAFLLVVLLVIFGYRLWWKLLILLLMGYLFVSKGFATIGYFPVYVGEIVMGVGLLTLFLSPFVSTIKVSIKPFLHWEIGVLILFLIWQVAQTIPYFRYYHLETLRDAVLYLYAAFAFFIMLLTPQRDAQKFFDLFGRLIPLILLWYPVLFFNSRVGVIPLTLPNAPNPLLYTKGSDLGVHIAGIGAYLMLSLNRRFAPPWLMWASWLLWGLNIVFLSALGRAMMVTAVASTAIVMLFQPLRSHWYRPIIIGVLFLCILLITGQYATLKLDLGIHRNVSAEQLIANIVSIFGEGDNSEGGLEGTKQWRLEWWDTIVNYTFHGPYFWTGKGYGINLANSDGFQVDLVNSSLRSPHNGHMTVLARSGVPGFVLWAVFLAGLALRLVLTALRRNQDSLKSRHALWLLAYLVAFVVMGGLDVFLESPMGGIWFWALIGFTYVYLTPDAAPRTRSVSRIERGNDAHRSI